MKRLDLVAYEGPGMTALLATLDGFTSDVCFGLWGVREITIPLFAYFVTIRQNSSFSTMKFDDETRTPQNQHKNSSDPIEKFLPKESPALYHKQKRQRQPTETRTTIKPSSSASTQPPYSASTPPCSSQQPDRDSPGSAPRSPPPASPSPPTQ
jgi:hypothetical protein